MIGAMQKAAMPAALIAVFLISARAGSQSQPTPAPAPEPFVVEYYYKVKWGHLEEFVELYTKNHYPLLKRLREKGDILDMSAAYPINHAGENDRWDFRFTITFKDAVAAYSDHGDEQILKELFPDQEKFKLEEQRRFELLIEHTDVPISLDDLAEW